MDSMTLLLAEASAAGLVVMVDGDRLRIRGPRRAEAIARRLLEHKPAVMAVLVPSPDLYAGITPDELPVDWWQFWDERSAIAEYDGGLSRERAEALALADTIQAMARAGVTIPKPDT